MAASVDLAAMHAAIIAGIQATFPAYQTVEAYPRIGSKITAPACFVDLVEMQPEQDPGTDQLRVSLRWEAVVVLGFRDTDVKQSVRAAAAALAAYIKLQRWGQPCGPAVIQAIVADAFAPDLDQYEAWRVEWEHTAVFGIDVWAGEGVPVRELWVGQSVNGSTPDEFERVAQTGDPLPLATQGGAAITTEGGTPIAGSP